MLSIQFILSIFKDTKAIQIIYFFMALSIIQIVDLFFTIFLTHIFGDFLIIGIICCISLTGLYFSTLRTKNLVLNIKEKCHKGEFPERYFFELTGLICAAILIFIPGFISAIIGFSLLIPVLSGIGGGHISKKITTDWHTVYEYMKI